MVVAAMFVGAALVLGPVSTASGQHTAEQGQAERAAESGISYALAQLRKSPDWRGDANQITVNGPDLFVLEDQGNVVGLVRTPDGTWSQFRLRFNYQDGATDQEGLPDPALTIDHPYVSINNLRGGGPAPVPRADGPGHSVAPAAPAAFQVPARAVSLAVEGRAGPGMRAASPSDPNPAPGPALTAQVVVEGIYQIAAGAADGDDAAAMAAGGLQAELQGAGKLSFQSKTSGRTPRLRSKREVQVQGGDPSENLDSPGGVVATGDGTVQAGYDSTRVAVKQEKPVDPFYQLAWSDLKRADPTGPTLDAGTYVWWEDGSLHYYDMGYNDYVNFIRANPTDAGSPPVLPSSLKVLGSGPIKTLELDSSLYVKGTSQTKDLAIVTRQGAPEDPPGGGAGGQVDVVAGAIVNQGAEQQFFQTCNFASGNVTVNDSMGNPMFSATWSSAMSPAYTFAFSANGPYTRVDLFRYLLNPALYPGSSPAPGSTYQSQAGQLAWVAGQLRIDPTVAPGQINPPGVSDSLTAADLAITFKGDRNPVTLSGDGDIRLTGAVQGTGGSITSGGDIRITGLGADFSASGGGAQAVNMYACGDITFSSLQPEGPGLGYANVHLKGVVYSWGDFVAKLSHSSLPGRGGQFTLDGSLIAYGGDPAVDAPGQNGLGYVEMLADQIDMTFDPSYVGGLDSKLPTDFNLQRVSWSNRLP